MGEPLKDNLVGPTYSSSKTWSHLSKSRSTVILLMLYYYFLLCNAWDDDHHVPITAKRPLEINLNEKKITSEETSLNEKIKNVRVQYSFIELYYFLLK